VESEEIVAELVHGFLLPEVQKEVMRDKGKDINRDCSVLTIHTSQNSYSTVRSQLLLSVLLSNWPSFPELRVLCCHIHLTTSSASAITCIRCMLIATPAA